MTRMRSYTKYENELVQDYRQRVNMAETEKDVQQAFARLLSELLGRIVGSRVVLEEGDVRLDPGTEEGYRLGPGLTANEDFAGLWMDSDLDAVLQRLAATAVKRLKHMGKRPERTEAKLYPRPDRR